MQAAHAALNVAQPVIPPAALEQPPQRVRIEDADIAAELWEIAENLHRLDLTKDQRDEHIRRYAELLEAKAEAARQVRQIDAPVLSDGRRAGPQHEKGVAKQVAAETGLSVRTVQRALNPPPPRPAPPIAHEPVEDDRGRRRLIAAWDSATEADRQWFREWIGDAS